MSGKRDEGILAVTDIKAYHFIKSSFLNGGYAVEVCITEACICVCNRVGHS